MNAQLNAKEARIDTIERMLSTYPLVISISANIPGIHKKTKEAYVLVSLFSKQLETRLNPPYLNDHSDDAGCWVLIGVSGRDGLSLKKELMEIEDTHPLGRLIDLDLFSGSKVSISRLQLGFLERLCLLCSKPASVCRRTAAHDPFLIKTLIEQRVASYLRLTLDDWIKDAMDQELALEDKFGLVTKTSQGSHTDMNHRLMEDAANVIRPYLVDLFFLGFNADDSQSLVEKARPIALLAESAMFSKTKGVNCYKGLIFILGYVLLSFGFVLSKHLTYPSLFETMKHLAKDVLKELEQEGSTAGLRMYRTYGFLGARGEIHHGLQSIRSLYTEVNSNPNQLRNLLKIIVLTTEDTVFLHRAGSLKRYLDVKAIFRKTDVSDPSQARELTEYCIHNGLSFGGAADLLIAAIFLSHVNQTFLKSI